MIPTYLAAILTYYRADATLKALLGGADTTTTEKIAFATLPVTMPSVTVHLDRDDFTPFCGYSNHLTGEGSVTLAFHVWCHDDGIKVGTVYYDAVSLQAAIAERLRVLSLNVDKNATIGAIAVPRGLYWGGAKPLPFEEDTHTHHTMALFAFEYTVKDTV